MQTVLKNLNTEGTVLPLPTNGANYKSIDTAIHAWLDCQSKSFSSFVSAYVIYQFQFCEKVISVPENTKLDEHNLINAKALRTPGDVLVENNDNQHELLITHLQPNHYQRVWLIIELEKNTTESQHERIKLLRWNLQYLEIMLKSFSEFPLNTNHQIFGMARKVNQMQFDQKQRQSWLDALANELDCDFIVVAYLENDVVKPVAISGRELSSINAGSKQDLIKCLSTVCRHEGILKLPSTDNADVSHELVDYSNKNQLALLALQFWTLSNKPSAILCVRKLKEPFRTDEENLLKASIDFLGSGIVQERTQLLDNIKHGIKKKIKRPGMLFCLLCLFTLFGAGIWQGNDTVTANAFVEGESTRVIVAPHDGFIKRVFANAGDPIEQDGKLLSFDTTDLQLERSKWTTEILRIDKSIAYARSTGERSKVEILKAQDKIAHAELAMIDRKLQRSVIHAPVSSMIINGELRSRLGAPVKRGDVLYELVPDHRYRLVLQVKETLINTVNSDQEGRLVLEAYPDSQVAFRISKLSPVAMEFNGENTFRVEAELLDEISEIRPGLQGYARINVGKASYLWIWTRQFREWLQYQWWRWIG